MKNVILDIRGRIKRERITLKPSFKVYIVEVGPCVGRGASTKKLAAAPYVIRSGACFMIFWPTSMCRCKGAHLPSPLPPSPSMLHLTFVSTQNAF